MPQIRAALLLVRDAKDALDRACVAWNRTQLELALNSASRLIREARAALEKT
jgi:hypothetical protein